MLEASFFNQTLFSLTRFAVNNRISAQFMKFGNKVRGTEQV